MHRVKWSGVFIGLMLSIYGCGKIEFNNATPYDELSFSPQSPTLFTNTTLQLEVLGGKPPIRLELVSGKGVIDSTSRLYKAPIDPSSDLIRATDARGSEAEMTITVLLALTLSPTIVTILPLEQTTLVASGGIPPYKYSVIVGDGSVNDSGVYTAGAQAGLARVQVTDSAGTAAVSAIIVDSI